MMGGPVPDPFVGRVEELAKLHDRLAEVIEGAPVTVMLSGESGLGKSELLARFTQDIAGKATVLSGACMNLNGAFPYVPLIEALRLWRRREGETRVRELAGPAWDKVSGLIADFTGDASVEGAIDSKRAVFGAISRMLNHIGADSPVVLIFEDVQWADLATLDLIAFFTQAVPVDRLMLICTYRPGLGAQHRLREMLAEREFVRGIRPLPLPGLSSGEIQDLLAKLGQPVDQNRLQRYVEQTNGNPYYVTQLAAAGGATDRVPPTLAEMLLSRVRQLGDAAAEVVRVVAVAGRRVSYQLLAKVCALEPAARERAIGDCLEREILILDRSVAAYRFQNPLLRDAIHESLPPGERVRLHIAMADALTANSDLGLSTQSELAYHWFEAGEWSRALAAGVKAGAFAARMSAFPEAETQYTRVLEMWPRVADPVTVATMTRDEVLFAAADAARWGGHIGTAVGRLQEAIGEIDPTAAPERAAAGYERLGSYLWEADASAADAQQAYQKAFELLRDRPPSPLRARVLAAAATGRVRTGDHRLAYTQADQALTEARSVGALAEQGRALNSSGLALTMLGKPDDGIASLQEAVRIADEVGHLEDLLRAYGNLSVALGHAGRLAEAVEVLRTARTRVQALELFHTRQSGVLANNLGAILGLLGKWDEAAEVLDEILVDRPVKESVYQRLTRAEIHIARGQFDAAQPLIDEVRAESGVDPRLVGPLYASLAELALWQGNPAEARAVAHRGLDAIAGKENWSVWMQLYAMWMRATADHAHPSGPSDAEAARAHRKALVDEAGSKMTLVRRVVAAGKEEREIAVLALLCEAEHARIGDTDTEAMWARTAAGWTELSRPYPAAYAQWRQAEAAIRAGRKPSAAEAARAALATAEQLRAAPLATRVHNFIRLKQLSRIAVPTTGPTDQPPAPSLHPAAGFGLTDRELQVLRYTALGETNEAIGRALEISANTVGVHLSNVYRKMRVSGRAQAVATAIERGFFPK